MKGLPALALRHALYAKGRTVLVLLALTISMVVPLCSELLMGRYDQSMRARAAASPLLAGAEGSAFDLVLETLFFRPSDHEKVTFGFFEELSRAQKGLTIPLHLGHSMRKYPLVGTSQEYHEQRGLQPAEGHLPQLNADDVLGATVATALGASLGDEFFSDPPRLYDLTRPAPMRLLVVGILAPTETADDGAVFTAVQTSWTLDGYYHGHRDAESLAETSPELVISEAPDRLALSGALIEDNSFSQEKAQDFHLHGEQSRLPLSSVLIFPPDAESRTILKGRINGRAGCQAVSPSAVLDDLLGIVFKIKQLLDRLGFLLSAATMALVVLVAALSLRLRQREMQTMDALGAPAGFKLRLVGLELGLIFVTAAALATGLSLLLARILPDLVTLL